MNAKAFLVTSPSPCCNVCMMRGLIAHVCHTYYKLHVQYAITFNLAFLVMVAM
jgi:hypothetical protein